MKKEELSGKYVLLDKGATLLVYVVRTKIMNFLCVDEQKQKDIYSEVVKDLENCVTTRQNICYLFAKEGYLQEQFEKEKILAEKLRDAFISTFDGF